MKLSLMHLVSLVLTLVLTMLPGIIASRRIKSADDYNVGGRSAGDETAVLAAVRGLDTYFNVHRGRYQMVGDKGENEWVPCEDGPHIRITEKMNKDEVGRIIDGLITRPPAKSGR